MTAFSVCYHLRFQNCIRHIQLKHNAVVTPYGHPSGHVTVQHHSVIQYQAVALIPFSHTVSSFTISNMPITYLVKYLIIKQHSDPNCSGEKGKSPLHVACHYGHMGIIQYLTTVGCDPELPDNDGFMPLHVACVQLGCRQVPYH